MNIYWVLVYITVDMYGASTAATVSHYKSMADCFDGRQRVLIRQKARPPYFPKGMQAVCIPTNMQEK